jgi:ribosomal protein S18 acetylase RimI-like enzyme
LSLSEPGPVTVGRLAAGDWQTYRTVRLAMLRESPEAFGGTVGEALGRDEQVWRQLLTDNVVLLARVGQTPAGSAMYCEHGSAMYSRHGAADPDACALFGMWVDPRFRRLGVARLLVRAVMTQARAAGRRRVILNVVSGNLGAIGFYEREGFVATGHSFPQRGGPLNVVEMEQQVQDGVLPVFPVLPG